MNLILQSILDTEWPSIKNRLSATGDSLPFTQQTFWNCRLTPVFPTAWPLSSSGKLIHYAYAAGQQPGILIDGERITAPWSSFTRAGDQITLLRLTDNPQTIGTQGVRPLLHYEIAIANLQQSAFEAAATSPGTLLFEQARPHYKLWANINGLIARHLRPRHTAFFEWLETT